jgi:hypothetical protein
MWIDEVGDWPTQQMLDEIERLCYLVWARRDNKFVRMRAPGKTEIQLFKIIGTN